MLLTGRLLAVHGVCPRSSGRTPHSSHPAVGGDFQKGQCAHNRGTLNAPRSHAEPLSRIRDLLPALRHLAITHDRCEPPRMRGRPPQAAGVPAARALGRQHTCDAHG